ncbi:ABC transporter substrate-binding protein [Phytohabitans sp. ZYX-F-186]|uniref:ABC transporter substrate-binding protein n=1 Tax=Phytohabitans maris TaxID=3071409 RepID=A0ABU0ZDK2_9ACTN|nr:ABC transporter substrate-binding protein [Phytohabitans sp. ZYX-F-186]MDQ7905129.1 ABC transporter substrate-binding protein [Phytohabitans sp. ZYX-F-186]
MTASRPGQRRRPSTLARAGVGLAAAATLLVACSSGDGAASSSASDTPRRGGALKIGVAGDPGCLDPQQNGNASSINISRQVVDSLTDLDPQTGATAPWLATSWTVNPDATQFTFTLRDGVTFSDGSPLTAEVVKKNFDTVVTLGAATSLVTGYLAGYQGTTALDAHTVRVDFKQPNAGFLQATSVVQLGILSAGTVAKSAAERCQAGNLVGTGPFVLESYTANQSALLNRRAGYAWPSEVSRHRDEAYLDSVEFDIVSEASVRTGALQSGQLDAVTDVQPDDEASFGSGGFSLLARANPGVVNTLFPKPTSAFAADPVIRKAIQTGLDRSQLTAVLSGSYQPATSVLAKTTPGYKDEQPALKSDPAAAGKLLDDAGWAKGGDGIRAKDGRRLSLDVVFISSVVTNQSVLAVVQQQLKDLGIELKLRPLAVADYLKAAQDPTVNFTFGNFTRPDLDILRSAFSSAAATSPKLTDDALEQLYVRARSTADATARAAIGAEIQDRLIAGAYAIPVYELSQVAAHSGAVRGLRFESSSRLVFYDTWLDR